MNRLDIRRLGVIYKGDLVGIISSKDILGVMPELIEIMQEKSRIEGAALGVKVSVVCPGYIKTAIFTDSRLVNLDLERSRSSFSRNGRESHPPFFRIASESPRLMLPV
jgi:hypothetical protein